jgi:DNA repair exonuclease SbcCD nuclease subunit
VKLVAFSDLHLDAQFAWSGSDPQAARVRRQALRETLQRIVRLVGEVNADALLCGGDLYEHERYTPDTAQFLRTTFEQLHPVKVFIAPGNHDWYGPTSLYHQVAWTENVVVFRESHLQPFGLDDGLTLWGAAHRAPANTDGFLDGFQVDRGGVNLALFHGSEQSWFAEQDEGKTPHAPFRKEQIEQAGLDHAFLGHFHRSRDADSYTYPGNPDPLTFGEDVERGAVIATVRSDGQVQRERRRVAVTDCHDLILDVGGCSSQQDVRDRLTAMTSALRGVARVTVQGEFDPRIDLRLSDLKSCAPGLDALMLRAGRLEVSYDFDAIAAEPTVRGEFARDVRAAVMPEDQRRRILITGLRALDGRDDLEVL